MNSDFNNSADMQTPNPHEQFELLSAYMDNEVSPTEKSQVEQWLAADPNFHRLYQRQLKLRQLLISLPTPALASTKSNTELVVGQVMAKLEKRSQRRKLVFGGSAAAAAVLIGAIGSIFTFNFPEGQLRVANQVMPSSQKVAEEPLILAMEKPIVPLPKSMGPIQSP